jgi:hypothetical protein
METVSAEQPKRKSELRKMGCSFLRQCRRRTQSEPPKNFKRDRLAKQADAKARYSLDEITTRQNQLKTDDEQNMEAGRHDNEPTHTNCRRLSNETNKLKNSNTCITDELEAENYVQNIDMCYDHLEKVQMNSNSNAQSCEETNENTQKRNSGNCVRKNSTTHSCNNDTEQNRHSTSSEVLCFPKFICCRRGRKSSNTSSYKNNNNYPYALDEYLRIPNSNEPSTVDSQSTCFSHLSTGGSSCPTLSSSELPSQFGLASSSANVSHDSGFDEPKCFINMIYENHRCKGLYSCHKKDKAGLNIHLRNLMNCMPKSFGDNEPIQDRRKVCSGVARGPTYSNKRRNAICETSDEMRVKFYEALCAFMTLQAMAKYDFF